MATVPRYEPRQTLQPVNGGLAGAEQTIEGRQLQELGRGLESAGQTATWIQERENTDRVMAAEADLKNAERQFSDSIRERRGATAYGATQDATKWWDDAREKYRSGLENSAQQRVFDEIYGRRRDNSLRFVSNHESAQRRQSVEDSANASIQASIDDAIASGDPDTIALNRKSIETTVRTTGKANGWTPEITDQKLSEQLTNLHVGVISTKAETSPSAARQYYETFKTEIQGSKRARLEKLLKTAGTRQASQVKADRIYRANRNEADMLAEARGIADPEVRDATVTRIKARIAEDKAIEQNVERKAANDAYSVIANGGGLDDIPVNVLSAMRGQDQITLKSLIAERESGKSTQTDWSHYYQMRQEAATDPEAFAQRNLINDFPMLDTAKRAEMVKLQESARAGKLREEVGSLEQQLSSAHNLMGWGNKEAEYKGLFDSQVRDAINGEQAAKGRALSYDERQAVIDRLLASGEVQSGHWYTNDPNKQFFQVRGTSDESRFVPDIPDDEAAKIKDALERAGMPVNDENLLRLYRLKMGL